MNDDTAPPAKPGRRKPSAKKAPAKAPRRPRKAADASPVAQQQILPPAFAGAKGWNAQDDRAGGQQRDRGAEPPALIRVPMPVRWRDLDAFNHVNNSKYLSYLEEARLRWMLGVPGRGMDEHVAPVVAAATLNYRRPIEWPNEIVVELFVERLGTTSLSVGHRIVAADDAGVLFCDGHVVMVWIDRESGSAAPLPQAVREVCSTAGVPETYAADQEKP